MPVVEDVYASRIQEKPEVKMRKDPVVYGDTNRTESGPLNKEKLLSYQKNGFLFMERLFRQEEVDAFLKELSLLAAAREKGPEYILEPRGEEVRSIFQIHRNNPLFRRLSADPRLVGVARQILNSDVYIHQSRINLKPGFIGKEFYWHSDFETWHVEDGMPRMRAVSCSINLTDNYPFNGPLMVIPGSHMHYICCVGQTPAEHYKRSLRKQEYGVPDQKILSDLCHASGIEAPAGPAGSALFFDCNIMHGSNGNITPFPRSNVFFVFNSIENQLVDPFGHIPPRPEFIGTREHVEPLRTS